MKMFFVQRDFPSAFRMLSLAFGLVLISLTISATSAQADDGSSHRTEASVESVEDAINLINEDHVRLHALERYGELSESGEEVMYHGYAPYQPESASQSEGFEPFAYPSNCGMHVWITRSGQQIKNHTETTCNSMNFNRVEHRMDITAYHGVFGYANMVNSGVFYHYLGDYGYNTLSWTCKNSNATGYRVHSSGHMRVGTANYSTPIIFDTFGTTVNCGW
ncbi:hypothetical protein [Leucobacter chinensis]|uniref:hypothetical protein n=1 Tax=Leucobacter chinensis TaxID=2851010 RepID=UPI001C2210FE|nr:hypothetical protein [Leucobacter chinensis]